MDYVKTKEDALYVKSLRHDKGYSWRMVSLYSHRLSTMYLPEESQETGRQICSEAQEFLGETWED